MANVTRAPEQEGPPFIEATTSEVPAILEKQYNVLDRFGERHTSTLIGAPGVGKSAVARIAARMIAESRGLEFVDDCRNPAEDQFGFAENHFANMHEETIAGMPWVNYEENIQRRAMATVYPVSGPSLWLMDEILHEKFIQRFAAQITHGGKMDDYWSLPEGVLPVGASNGVKHKAGVVPIHTHFQNRICEIHVTPTVEGALGAFAQELSPELQVYLRWFSSRLLTFDPKKKGPFASPRTWDKVNTLLAAGYMPTDPTDFLMFQGYVGWENASDFRSTFHAISELPNIDNWLADPIHYATEISATQHNSPNTMCAFVYVMLRRLQESRDYTDVARAIPVLTEAHMDAVGAFIAVAKDIDKKCRDNISILDSPEYAIHMARNPKITLN